MQSKKRNFALQFMIILGSTSPRRREILSFFHLPFEQIAPLYEEEKYSDFFPSVENFLTHICKQKALSIQKNHNSSLPILTADTCVYIGQKVLGKPENQNEAISMLELLQGEKHQVATAVCVVKEGHLQMGLEKTDVFFHPLSKKQILQYLSQISYLDKAGSYAVQQSGSIIVKKIEGCFYNIMGLPITLTTRLLKEVADIDLWHYLG